MTETITPAEYKRLKKGSKYRNRTTVVNSIRFDSKKEAARYQQLLILLEEGYIARLERQVSFDLHVNGFKIGKYICDFKYYEIGVGDVVEDCKSAVTARIPLFRWKKRHMQAEYGIVIREV